MGHDLGKGESNGEHRSNGKVELGTDATKYGK